MCSDDLDVSGDFFEYFTATYPLLRLDPSLLCVSAWNDNGKSDKIQLKPDLLYRTDFFPGDEMMMMRGKIYETGNICYRFGLDVDTRSVEGAE